MLLISDASENQKKEKLRHKTADFLHKKWDGTQEPVNVGHKTVENLRVTKVFPRGGVTQY